VDVQGSCDAGFEKLRTAFEESFEQGELGAAVAVFRGGRLVVDLWGGYADPERKRPWRRDTIANVYSTTKGVMALCALRLADRGALDVDAPVSRYWPEFAAAGKGALPVRWLLSHRAGLPAIAAKLPKEALFDWPRMCAALAEQEPWWEPGTQHGYHAMTFGHLVGEVLRRIDGRSVGDFLREELAAPLGLDFHIGVPTEALARCAEMVPAVMAPGSPDPLQQMSSQPAGSVTRMAFTNPPQPPGTVNSEAWRRAEIPAGNGHGDARSLARLYGGLATGGGLDGARLLSRAWIQRACEEQSYGKDAVLLGMPTRFGLGFMLHHAFLPLGPNKSAFGHPGAGGSIAFADPETGLGFAYVMNQMQTGLAGDARGFRLIQATYQSL
jgi:CubicO group peptidase (beta-lactamase class C family)